MRFEFGFIKKFAAALAVAVSASSVWAADYSPLYFKSLADSPTEKTAEQQKYWDDLMKYKIFGAHGIDFVGMKIRIPDESGWFGTADGDFSMSSANNWHIVGGPIMIGGNMSMSNGKDTLSTGPVRVLGDITKGYAAWENPNLIKGNHCVSGSVFAEYSSIIKDGALYSGGTYSNCPSSGKDSIPEINTELRIPEFYYYGGATRPALSINNQDINIDVPSGDGTYDILIAGINFQNQSSLNIRMPLGGRLTRIFVRDGITIAGHPKIRVIYMDGDAKGYTDDDGIYHWTSGSGTGVENKDYSGNLLFYVTKDFAVPAIIETDSIQGTFISTGTISVQQHMTLAGQLIADKIVINALFDGSGFRYVPFDPPVIDLQPEVGTGYEFPENNSYANVPIKLDVVPQTNVYFDYCFELTGTGEGHASLADLNIDETGTYPFPQCANGEVARVEILSGSQRPDETKPKTSIHINVAQDTLIEGPETLRLVIKNLSGAVMPGNKRDGYFDLTLVDANKEPVSESFDIHATEDEPYTFANTEFKYKGMYDSISVVVKTLPSKGFLVYEGDTLTAGMEVSYVALESGKLQFINTKNEYSGSDVYTTFTFGVKDVQGNATRDEHLETVSIYVAPVNDEPTVSANQTMSVDENSPKGTVVGNFEASDVDGDALTFKFDETDENYEAVSSVFSITTKKVVTTVDGVDVVSYVGVVTVKDSSKLDYESDVKSFTIAVKVTDNASTTKGEVKSSTGNLTINVNDVNEKQNVKPIVWTITEGETYDSYPSGIGSIRDSIVDADSASATKEWRTYSYTILENSDADEENDVPFYLNSKTGVLKIGSDASVKIDFETTPQYQFHVIVKDSVKLSDGSYGQFVDTVLVTIDVKDINEPPEFSKVEASYAIEENSSNGDFVAKILLKDEDGGEFGKIAAALTDLNLAADVTSAEDLFDVTIAQDATTKNMYVVVTVKDSAKLDYEALYADHYDAESGKVVFDIRLTVTDKGGEEIHTDTKIVVKDVNEEPSLENFELEIAENQPKGTVVGSLTASDLDIYNEAFSHLDYTIVTKNMPFDMDSNKVVVRDSAALNFEENPSFTFEVEVRNCLKNSSTGKYTESCLADTAQVKFTLSNVNENPEINCVAGDDKCNGPFEIAENSKTGAPIHTFAISDVDANDAGLLKVVLSDLDDAGAEALFDVTLDKTNDRVTIVVKDSAALNYEEVNAFYNVVLTVSDDAGLTDTLVRTIYVIDVNEAPEISSLEKTILENRNDGDTVAVVSASDPDEKNAEFRHLEYTIITKDTPFEMDSNNVVVSDASKLNYETTPLFTFLVEVKNCLKNATTGKYTENCLADTSTVKISLSNVNENPEIKCIAGDTKCNGPFSIAENSKTGKVIHSFAISDVDKDDEGLLTVTLTDNNKKTGVVSAEELFTVKVSDTNDSVSIVVKDSSKLDYEKVSASYAVTLTVVDAAGLTDTLVRTIKVIDVNEKPVLADLEESADENLKNGTVVATLTVTDPDTKNEKFRHMDYSVITANVPFEMDSNKVVVSDGSKLNYETSPKFTFDVMVKNCVYNSTTKDYTDQCQADTATITINLTNVNENPEIACIAGDTKCNGPFAVDENSKKGTEIHSFAISDVDGDDAGKLTVALTDNGKKAGVTSAEELFDVKLNSAKDQVTIVVKDSSKLNYEIIPHSFNITLTVSDVGGLTDTLIRTITIGDVNERPSITGDSLTVAENKPNGSVVGSLTAFDPDTLNVAFSTLTYGVVESGSPFKMDSNKVVVANSSMLNYEADSVFVIHVYVTDGTLSDTAVVTVTLSDVDENPDIVTDDPKCDETKEDCHKCDATIADCDKPQDPPSPDCEKNCGSQDKDGNIVVSVKENSPASTIVLEYVVKDEDKDDVTKLVPTFVSTDNSGADSLFVISLVKDGDDYKIVLNVANDTVLDYEKVKEEHKLVITVTDPAGLTDTIVRTVKVVDVNEAPVIVKQEFDFDEHNKVGSTVGVIEWGDDLDTKEESFRDNKVSLIGGDTTKFAVDPTGVITTKAVFNFETDPTEYTLIVRVEDKNDPSLFVVDTMTVTVNNVPEIPYITSTEFEIPENPKNKEVIGTITSEDLDDVDNKEERTYALIGTSEYVTVTEDGKILVKDNTKFDYEKVETISIKVKVTDPQGDSSDTTIVIKITDVNEAPSIVDQTIKVSEDAKVNTVIDTVVATDPDTKSDEYSDLTYTIVGGDSTVFKVDPKTGEVILKDSLDYEKKKEYELVVEVFDGEFRDTAKVTIKVENVVEKSIVEITQVCDGDSCYVKPDSVYTNHPDVTICWNEGREVCEKSKCTIKSKEVCQDTTLAEGIHTIVKEFKDPTTDAPGMDTVVVFVSTATPIVTVTANADALDAANIYTIEETVNEKDSSIYVNDSKNDIRVTIKDPVTKKDSSFVVKLELDTLNVSKKDLDAVSSVVDKGTLSLNLTPTSGVTRTPVNGTEVKVSYTEEVNGKKVTVSYVTDNDGEVVKTPVYDEKGNVDSIEVITVSYETTIGGKTVTVSYQADAITGQALNVTSDGTLTTGDKMVIAGSSSSSTGKPGSSSSTGSKPGSSSSSKGNSSGSSESGETVVNVGAYKVTYDYVDEKGNSVVVTYTIDEKGNIVTNGEGDIGYSVSYTYVNKFGNSATQSVFIVLDQVGPKVEILYPTHMQVVRSNYVEVVWTVNGVVQDTLTMQGLEKGGNKILRYYRDKAGNEAYDSVVVIMKDGKDVDLAVEQPVVELTKEKVEEYYAVNPPKEGEKVAISIKNPTTGKEVETMIAGTFGTEEGSGDTPYPGIEGDEHLGPTLAMEIKLPVVNDVGGLATLDDLVGSDGLVSLDGVDAKNAEKVTVEEYVETYCKEDFKYDGDISRANLYKSRMEVKVWIYTTIGNFVDYYSFRQDMNDPDYTNDAGMLQMYMELKPDHDGEVRTEDGHALATGAYLYKVDAKIRAELQCTLPPVKDVSSSAKKKGDVIKKSDEMLKSFGYKRPNKK